jgi:hypothetical protein
VKKEFLRLCWFWFKSVKCQFLVEAGNNSLEPGDLRFYFLIHHDFWWRHSNHQKRIWCLLQEMVYIFPKHKCRVTFTRYFLFQTKSNFFFFFNFFIRVLVIVAVYSNYYYYFFILFFLFFFVSGWNVQIQHNFNFIVILFCINAISNNFPNNQLGESKRGRVFFFFFWSPIKILQF